MLAGMALYIHLLVCAGLSLFIISGLYVYMVVCVVYAYNLTHCQEFNLNSSCGSGRSSSNPLPANKFELLQCIGVNQRQLCNVYGQSAQYVLQNMIAAW